MADARLGGVRVEVWLFICHQKPGTSFKSNGIYTQQCVNENKK